MSIVDYLASKGIDCQSSYLLERAFVHTSFVNENRSEKHDNERLEFMGDAVLELWVSHRLYQVKPRLKEGQMTTIRAQLVCEESLAAYTRQLQLKQFLKLGVGEEKSGGRERDSILANLFEAFLGALYIQCGMSAVDIICQEVISPQLKDIKQLEITDFKTRLQEFVQSDTRKTVIYEVVRQHGPSNQPEFEVVVKLDSIILGKGKGNSKKKAEQQAAKAAFTKLVR